MNFAFLSACLVSLALMSGARAADPAYSELMDDVYQWRQLRDNGYFDSIPAFEDLQGQDNEATDAIPDDMSYYPQYWGDGEDEAENEMATLGLTNPYAAEDVAEEEDEQPYEPQDPLQLRSSNDLRDPELLENSALWGTHYVSGGAGEGKQHLKPNGEQKNKQEVKSDATLPAYCEPPNPCPKGYKEDKNCQMHIEDTAEFNRKLILEKQSKGECACDSEHMKRCPKNRAKINTKSDGSSELQALLKNEDFEGVKRNTLVAKKSPHMIKKRYIADEKRRRFGNYYKGAKLPTVAKKSPQNMEYDKWWHLKSLKDSDMQM